MSIDPYRNPFDTAWRTEAILIRRRLIRLQDETRDLRRMLARKYNPNQPRVPAGNSNGGQWTDGGGGGGATGSGSFADFGFALGTGDYWGAAESGSGLIPTVDPTGDTTGSDPWSSYAETHYDDGSLASTGVTHRDGSRIYSEYAKPDEGSGWDERRTVTLPEGNKVTFETAGRTQTIRDGGPDGKVLSRSTWEPSGPEPEASVQQTFAPVIVAPAVVAAGAVLFGWLSQQNRPDGQQTVMAFTPRDYQPSQNLGKVDLNFVGPLSKEEVELACRYMPKTQEFANRAARAAGHPNQYSSMQAYGTNVHTRFKDFVEDLFNPDYRAERSFLKEGFVGENQGEVPYGTRGSVRTDAYEYNRATQTLCVYDLKTGGKELSGPRSDILANAIKLGFRDIRRIILIEVRPEI